MNDEEKTYSDLLLGTKKEPVNCDKCGNEIGQDEPLHIVNHIILLRNGTAKTFTENYHELTCYGYKIK